MSPDDPRHGTNAGHRAHFEPGADKTPCRPCKEAHAAYHRKRRARLYLARTDKLIVDATGTRRRIQALQALGWPLRIIAAESGYDAYPAFMHNITRKSRVHRTTAAKIAAVYDRLSGTPGPSERARRLAQRKGWPPPLAWDDIDTDEQPNLGRNEPRDLLAEWEHLRRCGESIEQAAKQLGVTVAAIQKAMERRREVA